MSLLRLCLCLCVVLPSLALAEPAAHPSLTVQLVSPQAADWNTRITANGSIAAWQEAIVGAEIGGSPLLEVLANVGDTVRKGQVLARMQRDLLEAEVAQSRANLAEAEASLFEAKTNADRARKIAGSGAFSAQQVDRLVTGEATAKARVDVLRARLGADQLRLAKTVVRAPDDGTISARAATVGAVVQAGQELFRLIRKDRLEWHAELPAADLAQIRPGMVASLYPAQGDAIEASVRTLGPTVNTQTRNAIVYADIRGKSGLRPGMFMRGEILTGTQKALTLPQSAVLLRDGFAYVYRVGADNRVQQLKVSTGRRQAERVEITAGLAADARVVASGVGFLADGDLVRVSAPATR